MKSAASLVLLFVFLLVLGFFQDLGRMNRKYADVIVRNVTLRVEVAGTEEARVRGLSDRESIPNEGGMLFLFDESGNYAIWMKGMRFPIDILWIRDGRIVHVVENAPPPKAGVHDSTLPVYRPGVFSDTILEVHAGTVERFGIMVDDEVRIRRYD